MSGELAMGICSYKQINIKKYYHKWTISNFHFYMEQMQGTIINCPTFSSGANDTHEWCLKVHLNGNDEENKDYLSVSLRLLNCTKKPLWAKFQL